MPTAGAFFTAPPLPPMSPQLCPEQTIPTLPVHRDRQKDHKAPIPTLLKMQRLMSSFHPVPQPKL